MRRVLLALFMLGLLSACGSATGSVQTPVASPSSVPTPPSGFACGSVNEGGAGDASVTTVAVEQNPGYDRFVIEFGGGLPSYSVTPQPNTTFTRSPKGDLVTLEGTGGVLIVVHSVTNWTSYSGPSAFQPGYQYLRQAMLVENYEGYQQWALGIRGSACLRVAELSSPSRLVVDVVGI